MAVKHRSKTITRIENARLRGTPRLKAVAQATGMTPPQKPYAKPRGR